MIGLVIVLSILLSFTMFLRYIQHSFTFRYAETDFDLIFRDFDEEQITEIQRLPFIDAVFPIRLLSSEARFKGRTIPIGVYAADSFESRNITYFSDRLLINSDKQILAKKELNPIIIDLSIARALNAGIGDKVLLPFGELPIEVPFIVAAISEPGGYRDTLLLWQGEQRNIFLQSFGEDPVYSLMFVKANDKGRAENYFINEFVPMWMIEEGFCEINDRSEIIDYNLGSLTDREEHLECLRYDLRYAPPIVTLTSVLGFITYLLVLYKEANKKLILHEKEFSILYTLGMPRVYFICYLILETVLIHLPSLAAAALIVKYVVYDSMMQAFLPWYLFIWYCLGAFALQIAAVVINGLIMHVKMKKTNIAVQLTKE